MKTLKELWHETRVLYHDKKRGFGAASLFFVSKLINKIHMQFFPFIHKHGKGRKWQMYMRFTISMFKRKWLVKKNGIRMYDFNGAFMPDIKNFSYAASLNGIFEDTFLVSCHYGDNYDKETVEYVDSITAEGPYGYKDGAFDATVKKGDVVIDAGAWAGDFGAYCASKGALAYCFEPADVNYGWLCETAKLNGGGKIIPVKMALGDKKETGHINSLGHTGSTAAKIVSEDSGEKTEITTLDAFVEEHNLQRVDFIKSDIEGFERNLLMGGVKTLKRFAPKLAICTYHLPDDPKVLSRIIKEANPDYTIVQMRHKLFACVERKPGA